MKDIIQKAVDGGYELFWLPFGEWEDTGEGIISEGHGDIQYETIIFSHEFLRAYFGEGVHVCPVCGKDPALTTPKKDRCICDEIILPYVEPLWMYHAQQLVLAEDRLEYLRRFLNENKNP